MAWLAYAVVWLTFGLLWAFAASWSSGRTPGQALPYGLVAMTSAALMGVVVWRGTARVALDWRSGQFYLCHGAGLPVFAAIYGASWLVLEVPRRGLGAAVDYAQPTLLWNALMGVWLYLMIAGASYALRAHAALRVQEAAAADARFLAEQAQLAALRAQVNPHFLFNALHSVGALIHTDPARADLAIERLGDLLRYTLGSGDELPLRDEWQFTRDYLALEQLRLGDRLRVREHLDELAPSVFVPPLVLQPLVENAVRHGIADRLEGGLVEISAVVEGEHLVLRVTDDGGSKACPGGLGVGISSVRKRLAAIHGDRASLDVIEGAAGFGVVVRLPVSHADHGERG